MSIEEFCAVSAEVTCFPRDASVHCQIVSFKFEAIIRYGKQEQRVCFSAIVFSLFSCVFPPLKATRGYQFCDVE